MSKKQSNPPPRKRPLNEGIHPIVFMRRNLQCRFGIHHDVTYHDPVAGICGARTCNDCGESWDAIKWPEPPPCKEPRKGNQTCEAMNRNVKEALRIVEEAKRKKVVRDLPEFVTMDGERLKVTVDKCKVIDGALHVFLKGEGEPRVIDTDLTFVNSPPVEEEGSRSCN